MSHIIVECNYLVPVHTSPSTYVWTYSFLDFTDSEYKWFKSVLQCKINILEATKQMKKSVVKKLINKKCGLDSYLRKIY